MRVPVRLDGKRDYVYHMVPLEHVGTLMENARLQPGRCIVVTDDRVGGIYGDRLDSTLKDAGWEPLVVSVPAGERSKSPETLQTVYDAALSWRIDRKTPILALGGGVVGDLAGYAAATLLRGLPLVQLPTTLIAQVDSAIGGKTGINHPIGKNLIGAFHQPVLVCADPSVLNTLPQREWTSGLAEVVKHALIADKVFFNMLEANWPAILQKETEVVAPMIKRAAEIKIDVVSQDEREAGLRAILNFGHTFGHAIEKVAGYGQYTHGEAVALGMRAALALSKTLKPDFDISRADSLVQKIPIGSPSTPLPLDLLINATKSDKKVQGKVVRYVLLNGIGHAYVEANAPIEAVEEAFRIVAGGR